MSGPLTGVKVVDFSHWGVGPWSCMLLGGLGASVLRVDPPEGDAVATIPPLQRGAGIVYLACNVYKENIRLDLKSADGLKAAFELIRGADVFIENMSPGTIERLGLGYEALSKANPRLIYASATPYGRVGPMAKNAGIDCLLQAFSGFASISGAPGGRRGDASLRGAPGPEYQRTHRHGRAAGAAHAAAGWRVDVTMLGSTLKLQTSRLAEFFATGRQPPRLGSAAATTAPHRAFQCQDGRWMTLGVISEAQWRRFCLALQKPDLSVDSRFLTNALRVSNAEALYALLEETFASRPYRWWEIRLSKYRVPRGPVLDFSSIVAHQEMARYLKLVHHPKRGDYYTGSLPFSFDRTPLEEPWTRADPLEPSTSLEGARSHLGISRKGLEPEGV